MAGWKILLLCRLHSTLTSHFSHDSRSRVASASEASLISIIALFARRELLYQLKKSLHYLLGQVIIYVEGGKEKKKGGVKAISDWLAGGLNLFIKKFRGVSSLIASYIQRGIHWPRWVKQLNSRAQTIFVK